MYVKKICSFYIFSGASVILINWLYPFLINIVTDQILSILYPNSVVVVMGGPEGELYRIYLHALQNKADHMMIGKPHNNSDLKVNGIF